MSTPDLSFASESIVDIWDEAQRLFSMHWEELTAHKDIPLSPNFEMYKKLEELNGVLVVTARMDGVLIGYAGFIISTAPHYQTSLQATQDVVFLDPKYRRGTVGLRLIKESDRLLTEMGVQVVHQHVKIAHPALGKVLERQGYSAVETIYSKRLDRA